jgi:hypothetical protein
VSNYKANPRPLSHKLPPLFPAHWLLAYVRGLDDLGRADIKLGAQIKEVLVLIENADQAQDDRRRL